MFEAIDRWENEGGAAQLMHPPQPSLSECDNAHAATARQDTSDRVTPADSAQADPSTRHRSHLGQAAEFDTGPPTDGIVDDGAKR